MNDRKPAFPGSSAFLVDVRARVDAHFAGRSSQATGAMIAKTVFWLSLTAGLWALNAFGVVSFPVALLVAALGGFSIANIGFNVGHDAIHLAYARQPWLNAALGRSFDLLGGSSKTWAHSHNMVHHTWTNVPGVDGDLEPGPWMRFYPQAAPPAFIHRFQPYYAWFLYGFTSLVWVFKKDFAQLIEQKASTRRVLDVLSWKLVHFAIFLVVPMVFSGHAWWQSLLLYVVMLAASGVTLATVFQLAHVVEGVAFPRAQETDTMPEPWAEHVMRTTANFGRTPVTTFFTGGLDHQIEHHLFPRVCHIHYRAIAPIVERCAKDHGLPYLHSGSFPSALASHARLLGKLGRGDVEPASAEPAQSSTIASDSWPALSRTMNV